MLMNLIKEVINLIISTPHNCQQNGTFLFLKFSHATHNINSVIGYKINELYKELLLD